jgi:hypothetical protein
VSCREHPDRCLRGEGIFVACERVSAESYARADEGFNEIFRVGAPRYQMGQTWEEGGARLVAGLEVHL